MGSWKGTKEGHSSEKWRNVPSVVCGLPSVQLQELALARGRVSEHLPLQRPPTFWSPGCIPQITSLTNTGPLKMRNSCLEWQRDGSLSHPQISFLNSSSCMSEARLSIPYDLSCPLKEALWMNQFFGLCGLAYSNIVVGMSVTGWEGC